MKAKELAKLTNVSEQYIRNITKKASDKRALFITLGDKKYSYESRREGIGRPAYFYSELSSEPIKVEIKEKHLNIQLDNKQKEKLNHKLRIVTEFNDYKDRKKGTVKDFIKYVQKNIDPTYTERKHRLWQKEYKKAGARALIDKRGREKGVTLKLSKEQQRFLIMNFRAFGAGEINYSQLWEQLHRNEERVNGFDFIAWKQNKVPNICDRGTVQRFISTYYEKRVIEWTLVTKGVDLNKSYNQPAMGDRKEQYTAKNQCWEIDSTPADVVIFHEGNQIRPDILAIKDCYSGRCVAALALKSNTLAIIRLLWKAISTLGIPKTIKGDNGRDYVSEQFQTLLDNLHIRYDKATAYAGDEKGQVERNFRTIQHSYMRVLAGFIGHNVGHRQKIEQQIAKKDRSAKDEFGNVAKTQTASSELLNWEEFDDKLQEAVLLWEIDKKRRKGDSPIELWNNCIEPVETMDYQNFLIYAGGHKKRTVQKDGINYENRSYKSNFIHKYRGQEVYVSENIDDMSEIFVFDDEGNFIGSCLDKDISPMKKEDFMKIKKEFTKETAGILKEIRNDKLSARSKSNIKDDLRRIEEAHKESLKPIETVHLENRDIQEKSKHKKIPKFEDRATVTVDVSTVEKNESIYAEYAIDY